MKYSEIETIVRANADADAGLVADSIDSAIKFISNFFNQRKINGTLTVSTGDTDIEKPANCISILKVKIGDDFIKHWDIDKAQGIEDDSSLRWYVEDDFDTDGSPADNKIRLTEAIGNSYDGDKIKIWYLAGFTPLEGVADAYTDVPARLHPILISFATYFYYAYLVSYIKNHKSEFPNMTLWDVISIWETWRIHAFDLLESVAKQHHVTPQN